MVIHDYMTTISCDKCSREFQIERNLKENTIRGMAAKRGWRVVDGQDLCPKCGGTLDENCLWIYSPGTHDSHFAITTCKPGNYNYLSKIGTSPPRVGVADCYNGCKCPICDRPIEMDYRFVEGVTHE